MPKYLIHKTPGVGPVHDPSIKDLTAIKKKMESLQKDPNYKTVSGSIKQILEKVNLLIGHQTKSSDQIRKNNVRSDSTLE